MKKEAMLPLYINVGLLHLMASSMRWSVVSMISLTRCISLLSGWFFFFNNSATWGFNFLGYGF